MIAVHFLLNTGFYTVPVAGGRRLLGEIYRSACMCCVPLFAMLSGALMKDKRLSRVYYRGLVRILVTYLLASAACMAVQVAVQGQPFSALWALRQLGLFLGAPYAWCVEMYLGLFLLIPFLNLAYHGLETKKQRLILILTLILLTAVPTLFQFFPSRWLELWPVTFYFLGAYLTDHPLRAPAWLLGVLFLLTAGLDGLLWYRMNLNGLHVWHRVSDWGGFGVVLATVLLFSLLRRAPADRAPGWLKKLLAAVSQLTLPAYLLSWISDQIIYGRLNAAVASVPRRLGYIPLAVPVAILASLVLSLPVEALTRLILRGIQKRKTPK